MQFLKPKHRSLVLHGQYHPPLAGGTWLPPCLPEPLPVFGPFVYAVCYLPPPSLPSTPAAATNATQASLRARSNWWSVKSRALGRGVRWQNWKWKCEQHIGPRTVRRQLPTYGPEVRSGTVPSYGQRTADERHTHFARRTADVRKDDGRRAIRYRAVPHRYFTWPHRRFA